MRRLPVFYLSVLILLSYSTWTHAAGTLWQVDFENTSGYTTSGTAVTYQRVSNPSGSGTVLFLTDAGTASNWGAEIFATNGRVFTFSDYGAVAGVDKLTYTFDLFVPETSVAVGDNFYMFTRVLTATGVDGSGATERIAGVNVGALAKGQWHTISGELLMPATANNNGGGTGASPATRVAAFLSYNDAGTLNAAGDLLYLDNINIGITPEPSKMLLLLVAGMAGLLKRRRSKPLCSPCYAV